MPTIHGPAGHHPSEDVVEHARYLGVARVGPREHALAFLLDNVDGGFTVFGRVLGGREVLNRFNNTSAANGVYQFPAGGELSELPVFSPNPTLDVGR